MLELLFWGWFGVCAVVASIAAYAVVRIGWGALLEEREARSRARETARIRARMIFTQRGQR